jgi:hypothetical protein
MTLNVLRNWIRKSIKVKMIKILMLLELKLKMEIFTRIKNSSIYKMYFYYSRKNSNSLNDKNQISIIDLFISFIFIGICRSLFERNYKIILWNKYYNKILQTCSVYLALKYFDEKRSLLLLFRVCKNVHYSMSC